jgi:zinc transport system substrate-binding protein
MNCDLEVYLLVPPGEKEHTYKPSKEDIKLVKDSHIVVCIGDESDKWIEELVKENKELHTRIVRFSDSVGKIAQGDRMLNSGILRKDKMDYHFWLSLREDLYFAKILEGIFSLHFNVFEEQISENGKKLREQLEDLDKKLINIMERSKTKEFVVADKFPFEYFVFDYNMKYSALSVGCNSDSEIKQENIDLIINRIKEKNISTIFYTDIGDLEIVNEIVRNTGCQAVMLYSLHNVSKEDFDKGVTMLDLININIDTIESVFCE